MQKLSFLRLSSLLLLLVIACKPEKSTPPCSDRYLVLSVEAEPESLKTYLQGLGIKSFFMSSQNYEWQSNAG